MHINSQTISWEMLFSVVILPTVHVFLPYLPLYMFVFLNLWFPLHKALNITWEILNIPHHWLLTSLYSTGWLHIWSIYMWLHGECISVTWFKSMSFILNRRTANLWGGYLEWFKFFACVWQKSIWELPINESTSYYFIIWFKVIFSSHRGREKKIQKIKEHAKFVLIDCWAIIGKLCRAYIGVRVQGKNGWLMVVGGGDDCIIPRTQRGCMHIAESSFKLFK